MNRRTFRWVIAFLGLAALALICHPGVGAFAQRGQGGGGGQGRGKGGGGETTTGTNLSYPAYFYQTSLQTGTIGDYSLAGTFASGWSYGCAVPETIGTTTYPNTSCTTETGEYQSASTCTSPGGKCYGQTLERMYWQKMATATWQGGYYVPLQADGTTPAPLPVKYIDWGDNLESRTWPIGAIRVETNTFSEWSSSASTTANTRLRFEMWHVFGQGTNELWGVHATNPVSETDQGVPYVYTADWPYVVNVSSTARLNIAKLGAGTAVCPTTATGVTQSPFAGENNLVWDSTTHAWTNAAFTFFDGLYTPELNIKGSYVYGYNWTVPRSVPEGVSNTGWWRITFYTPDGSIDFGTFDPALSGAWAPPVSTAGVETLGQTPLVSPQVEPAAETGLMLYVPQVDSSSKLTYIDVCIKSGTGGGGGGGGRPR